MGEQSYSVFEPASVRQHVADRADDLVFLSDGFSFWAMLMPVIWLIYYRLWWPLLGLVIVFGVFQGLAWLAGIDSETGAATISMGLSLAFGFLANDIRRIWLERKHYKFIGTVVGTSELDCERRFFDAWQPLAEAASGEGR